MVKKTVTYEDFNGQSRTEDFYFNLSEADLMEMQYSIDGGMDQLLTKISQEQNGREIIEFMKKIVLDSYGERSLDGKYFNKSEEVKERFRYSAAYNHIFMELATDAKAAADFVNGIFPSNIKVGEGSKFIPQKGPSEVSKQQ